MNLQEAAAILAMITALDSRKAFNEIDAQAWAAVLGDVYFDDARQAVIDHYRDSTYTLMPADVVGRVKKIRNDRIGDRQAPLPPIDPSDVDAYAEWQRAWYRAVGDGMTDIEAATQADQALGVIRASIEFKKRDLQIDNLVREPE